jgi:hypothetical protein
MVGCCLLGSSSQVRAQGKQAIIILRSANTDGGNAGCEGAAEITYQTLYDAKLNAKDEIRLLNSAGTSGATISRDAYDHSSKGKIRDLFGLKWGRDGVLYAVSVAGQAPILALPDNMKPPKSVGTEPLSAFYGVMLSGEAREGKQHRKVELALRAIWKIYFLSEGAAVNDTLFNHAAEEASVSLWDAYLQKTNNYRASEANGKMRDALVVCGRADLERFSQGDYGSLDKARQKASRAQSVKDDDSSRQLIADIHGAQQQVEDARNKAEQLIKSEQWDQAIDAAESIRKYLDTWPDLDKMYRHALEQSHAIHLNAGDNALRATQLEVALKECSTARSRLPNSEQALTCVCRARNEIAVRDSKKNRQVNRPKDAKELLEKQISDSECKADPRLAEELKLSKCEYSQQLLTESRRLLGVGGATRPTPPRTGRRGAATAQPASGNVNVKLITMQNKKDFRDAREKLMVATEMCSDNDNQALLTTVNRQLSGFCVAEARKALQRNDNGTAYVYLQKADGYTPEDGSISAMLAQAKEKFQEQTRVNIGAVFSNRSGNGYAGELLGQLGAAVESAGAGAGLAQPTVLERDAAEGSLRAMQSGRSLNSPTVIFFGDLLTAGVRINPNRHSVSSTYYEENEQRNQWDRNIDAKNKELSNCEKQYGRGSPTCNGIQAERDRMRAYRDSLPRGFSRPYSFTQTDFQVQGAVQMSFRSTDSVSRATSAADTLSGDVSGQCQQREGVSDKDNQGAANTTCQISDEPTYLSQMFAKVNTDAQMRAAETLRAFPLSYYRRAQSSANKSQAVESYLRFLFLSSNKSGSEAEQAKSFLISYDPELSTDGVFH